jgi:aminoglycoside phosphotransferase (APT) family kinase protein
LDFPWEGVAIGLRWDLISRNDPFVRADDRSFFDQGPAKLPTTQPFDSIRSESAWERPPFVEIDAERLRAVIRIWRPHGSIARCDLIAKGGRNTNYIISFEDRPTRYVMRLYASDPDGWNKEGALVELLGRSVPMPKVVYSGFEPSVFERPFTVFEHVEGETLLERLASGYRPPESLIRRIGATLAVIHQRRYDKIGSLDERLRVTEDLPPFESWISLFLTEQATARLGAKAVERYCAFVESRRADLADIAAWTALVHGDYRPTNIFVHGDELAAIIDWEFAMAGHPFSDLGQIIRHGWMSGHMEAAFIAEYNKGSAKRLPDDWRELARLRDTINLLQLIGARADKPKMYADLKQLIMAVVDPG